MANRPALKKVVKEVKPPKPGKTESTGMASVLQAIQKGGIKLRDTSKNASSVVSPTASTNTASSGGNRVGLTERIDAERKAKAMHREDEEHLKAIRRGVNLRSTGDALQSSSGTTSTQGFGVTLRKSSPIGSKRDSGQVAENVGEPVLSDEQVLLNCQEDLWARYQFFENLYTKQREKFDAALKRKEDLDVLKQSYVEITKEKQTLDEEVTKYFKGVVQDRGSIIYPTRDGKNTFRFEKITYGTKETGFNKPKLTKLLAYGQELKDAGLLNDKITLKIERIQAIDVELSENTTNQRDVRAQMSAVFLTKYDYKLAKLIAEGKMRDLAKEDMVPVAQSAKAEKDKKLKLFQNFQMQREIAQKTPLSDYIEIALGRVFQ